MDFAVPADSIIRFLFMFRFNAENIVVDVDLEFVWTEVVSVQAHLEPLVVVLNLDDLDLKEF